MEKQNTVIHCSTQQDMEICCCVSDWCALESIWITLLTSSCSIPFVCVQLQSTINYVPRQTTNLYVFMAHPGDYVNVNCECPCIH